MTERGIEFDRDGASGHIEVVLDAIKVDHNSRVLLGDSRLAPRVRRDVIAKHPWTPLTPQHTTSSDACFIGSSLSDDTTLLEWPIGNHGMLIESAAHPSQLSGPSAAMVTTLDGIHKIQSPLMSSATISHVPVLISIRPSCALLPHPREGVRALSSLSFLLSGHNLEGCVVLARLQTGRTLAVEQAPAGSASNTLLGTTLDRILVQVNGISAPGCVLFECRSRTGESILGQSKAILLVDEASMCREVRSMEEDEDEDEEGADVFLKQVGQFSDSASEGLHRQRRKHDELHEQSNAVIRDLGSWMEFCLIQASQNWAEANTTRSTIEASHHPDSSATFQTESHLNSTVGQACAQSRPLCSIGPEPMQHQRMLALGIQVLEYAVDRAWSAVGEHVVVNMVEIFGMSFDQVLHVASCTDGQPLIHRAIRSGGMQILHTVLSWGDALGHDWVWDHLHPVQMADGGSVSVSALHLAASLDDGGYAAELLLIKYSGARKLWSTLKDSRGFFPSQYAAKAGNIHLDTIASGWDVTKVEDALVDGDTLETLSELAVSEPLPAPLEGYESSPAGQAEEAFPYNTVSEPLQLLGPVKRRSSGRPQVRYRSRVTSPIHKGTIGPTTGAFEVSDISTGYTPSMSSQSSRRAPRPASPIPPECLIESQTHLEQRNNPETIIKEHHNLDLDIDLGGLTSRHLIQRDWKGRDDDEPPQVPGLRATFKDKDMEERYILYYAERLWLPFMLCSMVQLILMGGALANTSTQISLAVASAALVSVPYVLLPGPQNTSKLVWILCVALHAIRPGILCLVHDVHTQWAPWILPVLWILSIMSAFTEQVPARWLALCPTIDAIGDVFFVIHGRRDVLWLSYGFILAGSKFISVTYYLQVWIERERRRTFVKSLGREKINAQDRCTPIATAN